MAVYLVLMPIPSTSLRTDCFEADFHPRSFGFRPGRNAHQAVEAIREGLRMGKSEGLARRHRPPLVPYAAASVVDADLAQYFDTIPPRRRRTGQVEAGPWASHRQLMRQVARRVSDGMILKLIKAWLRAPIMEEEEGGGRKMKANSCGTPPIRLRSGPAAGRRHLAALG